MANRLSRIFRRSPAEPLHQATLVFNKWRTTCSHCGGNARPEERFHERNYAGRKAGCGARFTAFTIIGNPSQSEIEGHRRVRQDIPFILPEELDLAFQAHNPPLNIAAT